MLITDSFVLLNYPKTGSTFARTAIKDIFHQRLAKRTLLRKCSDLVGLTSKPFLRELILPNIKITHGQRSPDQHGCYCQIPDVYRDREVVAVVRNPYARFLSNYEFRWWVKFPPVPDNILVEHFPSFPDLDIDDYVRLNHYGMIHGRLKGRDINGRIGNQTIQFIQMFFKNPDYVLNSISDDYVDSDQIFKDIAPITLLRQENLNEELAAFLQAKGYSQEETEYVRLRERVNVTTKRMPDRNQIWTKNALDYVQQNERMIFRILAAKGITYERPISIDLNNAIHMDGNSAAHHSLI